MAVETDRRHSLTEDYRIMLTWQKKAHRIISDESFREWERNGRKPGYRITSTAILLVGCLDRNDEHLAKSVFQRIALGWPIT